MLCCQNNPRGMLRGVGAIAQIGRWVTTDGCHGGSGDSRSREYDSRGDRGSKYGNPGKWDKVLRSTESSPRGDGRGSRNDMSARSGSRSPLQTYECYGCQHFEDPGSGYASGGLRSPRGSPEDGVQRMGPEVLCQQQYRARKAMV